MDRWRAFLRLTPLERVIVLEAATALLATWFGLRLLGFRRWSAVLRRMTNAALPTRNPGVLMLPSARLIARMEAAAARNLFFHANCLERSMVLSWLLFSRGIPSELRVGAKKCSETFQAHAWVECEGVVLNDLDDVHSHFVPFDGPLASPETTSP